MTRFIEVPAHSASEIDQRARGWMLVRDGEHTPTVFIIGADDRAHALELLALLNAGAAPRPAIDEVREWREEFAEP